MGSSVVEMGLLCSPLALQALSDAPFMTEAHRAQGKTQQERDRAGTPGWASLGDTAVWRGAERSWDGRKGPVAMRGRALSRRQDQGKVAGEGGDETSSHLEKSK